MKIENQLFDRIAKAAQDIYKKTGNVFSDNTVKNDKGVIYGGSSVDAPVFADENNVSSGTEVVKTEEEKVKEAMDYLSNTMTMEDYEKFLEEGGDLEDTEIQTIVTVVDKIRISLAAYCEDFSGDLEGISKEAIAQTVGNPALASTIVAQMKEQNLPITEENLARVVEAVSMTETLEPVNSNTALYLIQNHLKPTIENLYIAEHSVGSIGAPGQTQDRYVMDGNGGYYGKTGPVSMNPELEKQLKNVIESAGLEADEVTMEASLWMLQNDVAVTVENLLLADQISQVALPQDTKKLVESIVSAISNGEKATKALISNGSNYIRRATEAVEVVEKATVEDVKALVATNQPVTIENLAYQEKNPAEGITLRDTDARVVIQYRKLEELRLQMTLEASVRMLRSGIDIETASLSELVDQLKQVEVDYFSKLLQGEKVDTNQEHLEKMSALSVKVAMVKTVPAYVIGTVLEKGEGTINTIHERGMVMKEALLNAGEAYEALMTAPRADLGDSIQKAFQNVEDIIKDLNMEVNDANVRAVRILGYNSMAINEESITAVKAKDAQVQSLLKNLTPSVAMEMIRKNINPLDMPVEDVNRIIQEMKENLNQTGEEKYSKFLWKLEQNNEISLAEREAYVGIYRLLHQVESSDGAVIGSLMEQNMECTMKNLMTCVRIRKNPGIDAAVDDKAGVKEVSKGMQNSITAQIERGYFMCLAEQGLDLMEPERLQKVMDGTDVLNMTLEQFVDEMRKQPENQELKEQYFEEKLHQIDAAKQTEQQVIRNLQRFDLPVTFQNITSMDGLMYQKGSFFKQIFGMDEEHPEEMEQLAEDLADGLTDKESMGSLYTQISEKVKQLIDSKMMEPGVTSVDVRAMKTLHSQWNMVSKLSQDENYFIPLKTENGYTGIHLTISHKDDTQGKVSVAMESENLGNITAEFYVTKERISGYIATDKQEGKEALEQGDTMLLAGFNRICPESQIDYVFSKEQSGGRTWEPAGAETLQTPELYRVAKTFVENIRNFV